MSSADGEGEKSTWLDRKGADKFWPEAWKGEKQCKSFKDFTADLRLYVSALVPGIKARKLLECIAGEAHETITDEMIERYAQEVGAEAMLLKKVSVVMGPMLHKVCKGDAATRISPAEDEYGFTTFRLLVKWFSAQSSSDSCNLLARIMKPARAANLREFDAKLAQWDQWLQEYASKFRNEGLTEKVKETAMRMMMPQTLVDNRVAGVRHLNSYGALRELADDVLRDRRDNGGAQGGSQASDNEGKETPKKIPQVAELAKEVGEQLLGFMKGKAGGKGKQTYPQHQGFPQPGPKGGGKEGGKSQQMGGGGWQPGKAGNGQGGQKGEQGHGWKGGGKGQSPWQGGGKAPQQSWQGAPQWQQQWQQQWPNSPGTNGAANSSQTSGGISCHKCGGVGHIARNCATPYGKGIPPQNGKQLGSMDTDSPEQEPNCGQDHEGGNTYPEDEWGPDGSSGGGAAAEEDYINFGSMEWEREDQAESVPGWPEFETKSMPECLEIAGTIEAETTK